MEKKSAYTYLVRSAWNWCPCPWLFPFYATWHDDFETIPEIKNEKFYLNQLKFFSLNCVAKFFILRLPTIRPISIVSARYNLEVIGCELNGEKSDELAAGEEIKGEHDEI